MRRAYLAFVLASMSGCAYNVAPTTAPAINVYSSYEQKVPGKWAVVLDESVRTVRRDIKPATYICSAHSYPLDAGSALSSSVRKTLEQVIGETVLRDAIPNPQSMKSEGITGSVFVKLDEFHARLACQQGFWSGTCNSTVDISIGSILRNSDGQVLLSTSAGSSRTADGSAGGACSDAGAAMAEATSRAMKDTMERLAEKIANSNTLRGTVGAISPSAPMSSAPLAPPLAPPGTAPPVLPTTPAAIPAVAQPSTKGTKPAPGGSSLYQLSAEQHARTTGCQNPTATMILRGSFTETFSVACSGGEAAIVRCEGGSCKTL